MRLVLWTCLLCLLATAGAAIAPEWILGGTCFDTGAIRLCL